MKWIFLILTLVFTNLHAQENPYILMRELRLVMDQIDYRPKNFETALVEYQKIYSYEQKLNFFIVDFHNSLKEKIEKNEALSGEELTLLHKGLKTILVMHDRTLALAEAFEPSNPSDMINADLEQSGQALFWMNMQWAALSRVVTLYDRYMHVEKLRYLLNSKDSAYQVEKDQLSALISMVLSQAYLKNIKGARSSLERRPQLVERHRVESAAFDQLYLLLDKYSGYEYVEDLSVASERIDQYDQWSKKDGRTRVKTFVFHHLSGAFGNFAGSIRWRKGYLDNNPRINKEIEERLIPFDMITERTPFALTDTFIPGNFGHNAIWLGTKEQLIALNLWDHPSVEPIQKWIEIGYSILETDRKGTHLKTIAEFMKIDEFAIMRNKEIYKDFSKMEKLLEVAIAQLGKKYDFNFDVETTDRLVCSELLYQSFGDIKWPTEYIFGRHTISPDNVTELMFYGNPPNQLVYYVNAPKKGKIEYPTLYDLAPKLNYRLNKQLSTTEVPYFEEKTKKCKKMIKDDKIFGACTTVWIHHLYE